MVLILGLKELFDVSNCYINVYVKFSLDVQYGMNFVGQLFDDICDILGLME